MGLYMILMGVQGAGKGVQASFIQETYDIPHISTGDLFRAMKSREDELARRVQDIMASGSLVPDDVTNEILQDRLEQPDAANGVILDGYPRNPAQAEWLENYLQERGESVTAVLLLELDLYSAFRRAFGRITSKSGESYNIYTNDDDVDWQFVEHPDNAYPPRLEATLKETGEALKRRPDDANAHSIIVRIDTFLENTKPLIEVYEEKGLLKRVNAKQSIKAVSADVKQIIDSAK